MGGLHEQASIARLMLVQQSTVWRMLRFGQGNTGKAPSSITMEAIEPSGPSTNAWAQPGDGPYDRLKWLQRLGRFQARVSYLGFGL